MTKNKVTRSVYYVHTSNALNILTTMSVGTDLYVTHIDPTSTRREHL